MTGEWQAMKRLCSLLGNSNPEDWPNTPEDWTTLWQCARNSGVGGLVYARLREQKKLAALPPGLAESMERAFYAVVAANTRIRLELQAILRCFHAEKVPVVVLKGADLAESVYAEGERAIGDLDLLVPRQSLSTSRNLLRKAGYEIPPPYSWNAARKEARHHHLAPMVRQLDGIGVWVELHHALIPLNLPFQPNLSTIWHHPEVSRADTPCRTLHPRELLELLVLHLVYTDCFTGGIRALNDLAAVLKKFGNACAAPPRLVPPEQLAEGMRLALFLLEDLLHQKTPPAVAACYSTPRPSVDEEGMQQVARELILNQVRRSPLGDLRAGMLNPSHGRRAALRQRWREWRHLNPGQRHAYLRYHWQLLGEWGTDFVHRAMPSASGKRLRKNSRNRAFLTQWLLRDQASSTSSAPKARPTAK